MFCVPYLRSLEQRMVDKLQRIVQEEVNAAMKEQQTSISDSLITAMRSGALTPSVHSATPDPQKQQADILHLLQQGQLNTAFQQVRDTDIAWEQKKTNMKNHFLVYNFTNFEIEYNTWTALSVILLWLFQWVL